MSDHAGSLISAIAGNDPEAFRPLYRPDARLITMTPNTFKIDEGLDAVVARLADWFHSWEEDPRFAFLATVRDGDRVFLEFERTSTYEGEPWVVRQAHVLDAGADGIREHRIYCCGPRVGAADLAAAYEGVR